MGVIRERMLRAVHMQETDIIPYAISWKPEVDAKLAAYYGDPDFAQRVHNHRLLSIGPNFIRQELDEYRFINYCGSVMQKPQDPRGATFRVVEPALPEPTLRGFSFPDPAAVELAPYPEEDGLVALSMWGFLETTSYMRGFARSWLDFAEYPGFLAELFDAIADFCLGLMERCRATPIDFFHLTDDWGSQKGLLISPRQWRELIKPRVARVAAAAQEHGWLVSLHSDGNISQVLDDLVDMGVTMVNPVQPDCMDVYAIKRRYGKNLCIYGGVSNQWTIPFGTPVEIRQEITTCFRELGKGGGYILSTGKEMRAETPVENAVAVIETCTNQAPLR